jgi:hypothetical protein
MVNDSTPKPERGPRIKPPRAVTPAERSAITVYIRDSVPDKHKIATERALLKQVPRSVAIKTKCLACCNFDREEVKLCAVYTCPLNPYRPYQSAAATEESDDGDADTAEEL